MPQKTHTVESAAPQDWQVGERAYCIIPAVRGWYEVVEVKGTGTRQKLKIRGYKPWCPATNFRREAASWLP